MNHASPLASRPQASHPRSREIRPSVLYFGTPVALVATLNADGSTNLSPMSSVWALDDRLVLGLGTDGQAYANLRRRGECVVNLPSPDLWPAVERIGRTTGCSLVPEYKRALGYVHAADKFAVGRLTPLPSLGVAPQRVAECPLQIEARVVALHAPGAGTRADVAEGYSIVEVEALHVHAHEDIVVPDTQHVDTARWSPLFYVFRHYAGLRAPLAANFRAELPLPAE